MSMINVSMMLVALLVGFAIGMLVDHFWVTHHDEAGPEHKRLDWHDMWERIRHQH
ncbi:hypothetical protein PPN31114_04044 [Pandoraea pneumonica]|jgi:hypothetical protein|uniref:Uncharacterized protein n=1 Tax=Pandoraea pneumonica TaxID=2508299 RepID=A0A5E4XRY8_9BURK|nr:hypothetical protein [Pandoraea pneumonica]VVE38832.1 hypothetical protein PPN31114_04044 [Pandoraea pneumonica]